MRIKYKAGIVLNPVKSRMESSHSGYGIGGCLQGHLEDGKELTAGTCGKMHSKVGKIIQAKNCSLV